MLAAGGDGTAVALVNALARATADGEPFPTVGVLPLGTGNGWAHALGAPKLHRCLELLARAPRTRSRRGAAAWSTSTGRSRTSRAPAGTR